MLCVCPMIVEHRARRFDMLIGKWMLRLERKHKQELSSEEEGSLRRRVERMLFPKNVRDFLWGAIPVGMRGLLNDMVGDAAADKWARFVKYSVWEMYAGVYSDYMGELHGMGWGFADRLKVTHKLLPWQLAAKHAEHRARQAREREQRQAAEQHTAEADVAEEADIV